MKASQNLVPSPFQPCFSIILPPNQTANYSSTAMFFPVFSFSQVLNEQSFSYLMISVRITLEEETQWKKTTYTILMEAHIAENLI